MRWRGGERSKNVEDRRGLGPKAALGGGLGFGGILVLIIVVVLGGDPKAFQQLLGGGAQQEQQPVGQVPGEDDQAREFIEVTLKYTEDVWHEQFKNMRASYLEPRLQIFEAQTQTACGLQSSKVGPFYCPADEKIYIDPTFFLELRRRHGAPGDFAMAYVIAHEVAHHVQRKLPFGDYGNLVDRVRQRGNQIATNQMTVRLELQADYLAGVWAHHVQRKFNVLEKGDPEEAINAAYQIGDDTLQKKSSGFVRPERFTHGTSKQRVYWFKKGFASGDVNGARILFELKYEEL